MRSHLFTALSLTFLTALTLLSPGYASGEANHERARVACEAGKNARCLDYARAIGACAFGVDRTLVAAAARVREECKEGSVESCYQAGLYYDNGIGGKKDPKRAAEYMALACEKKHPKACNVLGLYYQEGMGVEKDHARAFALYTRVCTKDGESQGCLMLGSAYVEGIGTEKNLPLAITHFTTACEAGEVRACERLGYYKLKGLGMKRDLAGARALFEQACAKKRASSCTVAGAIHAGAWGMEYDKAKAIAYSEKGCRGGHKPGCERAKRLKEEGLKPSYAEFTAGCKKGCQDEAKKEGGDLGVAEKQFIDMCEFGCGCFIDALIAHPAFVGFEDGGGVAAARENITKDPVYMKCAQKAATFLTD